MTNRWTILAVLFLPRLTMGMQYQSIAAVSPLVIEAYAVTLADVGSMIGLYLGPGILVAIPGSIIAARLGEKRVVVPALFAMLMGGSMLAVFPNWTVALLGRVLARRRHAGDLSGLAGLFAQTAARLDILWRHQLDLFAFSHGCIEANSAIGVARWPDLPDLHQQTVPVTIDTKIHEFLRVPTGFPLDPQGPTRARPIGHPARLKRMCHRLGVHPRHHQDLAAGHILGDGRDQPICIKAQAFRIEGHSACFP